jgi:hypothetical protein
MAKETSAFSARSSCSAAQRAKHELEQRSRQYDRPHPNQTRLHGSLSEFYLVRASARCGVLKRTPHEGEHADSD